MKPLKVGPDTHLNAYESRNLVLIHKLYSSQSDSRLLYGVINSTNLIFRTSNPTCFKPVIRKLINNQWSLHVP